MSGPVTLIQLSDPHVRAAPGRPDEVLDRAVWTVLAASDVAVAGVLLTGDLSDDGSPASYARIRAALRPLHDAGLPVVALPGNHDDGPALRRELLGGGPVDRVLELDGVRVAVVDSTLAGRHHGVVDDAELERLADRLRRPRDGGTILALHHPPLPFADPVLHGLALRAPERLAAAIAGSDVRLIVCGHAHQTTAGLLGATPVWCAPALDVSTDGLPPAGRARSFRGGGGLTRIELGPATATTTVVPLLDPADLRYDEAREERVATLRALEAAPLADGVELPVPGR